MTQKVCITDTEYSLIVINWPHVFYYRSMAKLPQPSYENYESPRVIQLLLPCPTQIGTNIGAAGCRYQVEKHASGSPRHLGS